MLNKFKSIKHRYIILTVSIFAMIGTAVFFTNMGIVERVDRTERPKISLQIFPGNGQPYTTSFQMKVTLAGSPMPGVKLKIFDSNSNSYVTTNWTTDENGTVNGSCGTHVDIITCVGCYNSVTLDCTKYLY